MKHCWKEQANQAAADRVGGERFGRKHGGLEASRETVRARGEVKSRGLLDWSFASDFKARLALFERPRMRGTLQRDHDGQHEPVHCSATAPRKCIETGCVVEQRPTDGLKRLQEPNS